MWRNQHLNECADAVEWRFISEYLPESRNNVLDLGCGIGRLARRLSSQFNRYTGIDLEPMICEARRLHTDLINADFKVATIGSFDYPEETFDGIVSLGCLSCALTNNELGEYADKLLRALIINGRLILLEPFHTNPLLVRSCRISSSNAIKLFENHGFSVVAEGRALFAPTRILFSKSHFITKCMFTLGEALLSISPRCFADYSFVAYSKC
jgi:SAM-dependent methyltransferase